MEWDDFRQRTMTEVAFKEGKPSECELDVLAGKISAKWDTLGIHLGIIQDVLDEIAANAKKKPYRMLLRWRDTTTSLTPYEDLYHALCHVRVGLNNVAREFCCNTRGEEDSTDSMTDCSRDSSNEYGKAPIGANRNVLVKPGIPEDNELHELASDVSSFWKKLGRELKLKESKLSQLDVDHRQDAYEKAMQMLLHWKETRDNQATYQILYNALTSSVMGRNDLGKKYCCVS
ncbi:uncharacterized protein LOC110052580 isoform X2 [Orbicella faveolata]|uniref:uncharacterized protein LOC110052580 isoform X2 n=1 Tax=Orbicella faveolata TaxID=48498 RepID=UPI0009E3EBDE|nr:uncharacterized protein LOC110052580 isoform X2 [Orbicella faveolata]